MRLLQEARQRARAITDEEARALLKAKVDAVSISRGYAPGNGYVFCPHCFSIDLPTTLPGIHPHQPDWNVKQYTCEANKQDIDQKLKLATKIHWNSMSGIGASGFQADDASTDFM